MTMAVDLEFCGVNVNAKNRNPIEPSDTKQ